MKLEISVEKYLYPLPEQSFDSLTGWLREIRQTSPIKSEWDEEEYMLWIKNLWFRSGWEDVLSYLKKKNLEDKVFSWGIGKYWDKLGRCTLAERPV